MKDYYEKNKRPVNNTIKKIMIGKVFAWNTTVFVILGVRRNVLYGHLEILAGHYPYSKKYGFGTSIAVYSWYCYEPKNMTFIGRDKKQAIRNCLKKNPKYITHHLGRQLDPNTFVQYQGPPLNWRQGSIVIYDDRNYYRDYLAVQ